MEALCIGLALLGLMYFAYRGWSIILIAPFFAGLAALASFGAYQPEYSTSGSFKMTDLDLILDERARELYAEGQRWMDLRRTKQLVRYNVEFSEYISAASDMANNKGEIKWYRPIPANEISANSGISQADQNPGY